MVDIDKKRHILKAITWRVLASASTFFISWIVTGSVNIGASIMSIEALVKIFLYYIHERSWYRLSFGLRHRNGDFDD